MIFEQNIKAINLRHLIILILFVFSFNNSFSQYFVGGDEPSGIKWKQIKTENFQIIYPLGYYKQANYVANLLEYSYDKVGKTLDNKPSKVSVVLHNNTVISNAFVSYAPKRMEFYTVAPQNNYGQDWFEQLAIHEFRHAIQFDKLNEGITSLLYLLFGEHAILALDGLLVPLWFTEGDAVCAETGMSQTGRGRTPDFTKEFRAMVIEKKLFRYSKTALGSYKDYVPDHYKYGYLMTSFARKKYGPMVWEKVISHVSRLPFIPPPFNWGLRSATNADIPFSKSRLYRKAFSYLETKWRYQDSLNQLTPCNKITNNKVFSNYENIFYYEDSLFVCVKNSIDDIKQIMLVNRQGKERILHTPGTIIDGIWLRKHIVVWNEYSRDIRWSYRTYSILKTLNIKTGEVKKVTTKTRYFAPCLSPDLTKIVCVEVTSNSENYIVVVDANSGAVIKRINTPQNSFVMTPTWSDDGNSVVATILTRKGKSIVTTNINTGTFRTIIQPTFTEIANPIFYNKYILFNGAFSGIDNIYATDTNTLKTYQVTSSRYDAVNADYNDNYKKFVYSDYTVKGFAITETDITPDKWKPLEQVAFFTDSLAETLSKQEGTIIDSTRLNYKKFKETGYSKLGHVLNIHSWYPTAFIYDNKIEPGLTLLSQNKLGTAITTFGFNYNSNLDKARYFTNFQYRGFYPIIDFGFDTGERLDSALKGSVYVKLPYSENNINYSLTLPFEFVDGKYSRYLGLTIGNTIKNVNYYKLNKTFNLNAMNYIVEASNLHKVSLRDLNPKYGQYINITMKHFNDNNTSKIFALKSTVYFPGIMKHHSLELNNSYQYNDKTSKGNGFYFDDILSYPDGDKYEYNTNVFISNFNYKFPVCYPDIELIEITYIKRISMNLFYTLRYATPNSKYEIFNSAGVDINFDFHLLRIIAPLNVGIRTLYVFNNNSIEFFPLFSIKTSL